MGKVFKIIGLFFIAILTIPPAVAQQRVLSDDAKVSILTSAPHDGQVFTVFGHAAIRVEDKANNLDWVFNYGIFDFTQPNFILRFALGETDYKLEIFPYAAYILEYQMRGSDVTEQVLNLTKEERDNLFEALVLNAQPENKVYRYNFFFDNCATRLPQMIERSVNGKVIYNNPPKPKTFRQMVHDCTGHRRWLTFGIDLALGSPADRQATTHQMMFLPVYVKEEFNKATIQPVDGTERKMVFETKVTESIEPDKPTWDIWNDLLTPMVCGLLLFVAVLTITVKEWKNKKYYRITDIILFAVAGIAGCVLFFLCFVSVHPSIWPNWSVLWLHPFHLIGVVLFSVKKTNKAAYWYHFINFAALSMLLLGWYFIPQQMNTAFIPFVATLWLRSASYISKRRKE